MTLCRPCLCSERSLFPAAGENGLAEGMEIAQEMLEQVHKKASGVCIMPSFGRFDVAAELAASINR